MVITVWCVRGAIGHATITKEGAVVGLGRGGPMANMRAGALLTFNHVAPPRGPRKNNPGTRREQAYYAHQDHQNHGNAPTHPHPRENATEGSNKHAGVHNQNQNRWEDGNKYPEHPDT